MCLLDSSCCLFQILNMICSTKLVDYSDTDSEEEVVVQAPVTGGQEENNNCEIEVVKEGPSDPDGKFQASGPVEMVSSGDPAGKFQAFGPGGSEVNHNLVISPATYPAWAPPTTMYRSLAREPVWDLTVNGVSCKLQSVMVELGGKAGKVAFLAKNGVVDVTPKRMALRKKVLVSLS